MRSFIAVALVSVFLFSFLGPVRAARRTAAAEPGAPVVGYYDLDGDVIVADVQGTEVGRFEGFLHFSLDEGIIAGERQGKKSNAFRVVVYDVASGQHLYAIPDARLPVVLNGGKKIAFFPSSKRDRYTESVWMRYSSGRIKRIALFKAGPGFPGIRHGMKAGAFPLDMAFDERGRTMAVVAGLETTRTFDVWVVDTKTREYRRVTRGQHSHSPSLSPDGSRLAVRVEDDESCPDPIYGEILVGKIRVFDLEAGEQKTLTQFDCDLFYDNPRWLDDDTLVMARVTKDAGEQYGYDIDVVTVDVDSGQMDPLITEGNPCCLSVSPSLRLLAHLFTDKDGVDLFDVGATNTTHFPAESYDPHVSGENRF